MKNEITSGVSFYQINAEVFSNALLYQKMYNTNTCLQGAVTKIEVNTSKHEVQEVEVQYQGQKKYLKPRYVVLATGVSTGSLLKVRR